MPKLYHKRRVFFLLRLLFFRTRYLDKPYWRRLNDPSFFNQASVGYGTVVWPDEVDLGPEDIWEFAVRHS